jgi:hypothetical protein
MDITRMHISSPFCFLIPSKYSWKDRLKKNGSYYKKNSVRKSVTRAELDLPGGGE